MKIKLDLDIKCPKCGNENVAWQITTSSDNENILVVDTICSDNNTGHKFGRQYMDFGGNIVNEDDVKNYNHVIISEI